MSGLLKNRKSQSIPIIEFSNDVVSISQRGQVVESQTFSISANAEPQQSGPGDAALVEWLKATLMSGRESMPAIVCIPRTVCCIHRFSAPTREMPQIASMVELEVESLFGNADDYQWDFIVAGSDPSNREVIVYVVELQYMQRIRDVLAAASIRPESITLTETALAATVTRENEGLSNLIVMRRDRTDVMIAYEGCLLQHQAIRFDHEATCDFNELQGVSRRLGSLAARASRFAAKSAKGLDRGTLSAGFCISKVP